MTESEKRRSGKRVAAWAAASAASVLLAAVAWGGGALLAPEHDGLARPVHSRSSDSSAETVLERPVGVCLAFGGVLVTDSSRGRVVWFDSDGEFVSSFRHKRLKVPLYVAVDPLDGTVWVSDRRARAVHVFDSRGRYLRRFDPGLPVRRVLGRRGGEAAWAPMGLAFAPDGTLYVTDVLGRHRLLQFDPKGKLRRSMDALSPAKEDPEASPGFSYPTAVRVRGDEVWVSDSNNRRLQVFDRYGARLRVVDTEGLTRGFDFLPKGSRWPGRLAVVDTFAHKVVVRDESGRRLGAFGGHGHDAGRFSYPNDVAIAEDGRVYVADTANSRLQVWVWPKPGASAGAGGRFAWLWLAVPLPLVLPLLRRRQAFLATPDFLEASLTGAAVLYLHSRHRRWYLLEDDYEELVRGLWGEGLPVDLFEPMEHPGPDAVHMAETLEVDGRTGAILAVAARSHALCTQDPQLLRLGTALGIEALDLGTFMRLHGPRHGVRPRSVDEILGGLGPEDAEGTRDEAS